jgi:hypothetical protein
MINLIPSFIKLSKSLLDIAAIKKTHLDNNDSLLTRALHINAVYNLQPARTLCKACGEELSPNPDLANHQANYVICRNCSHLNGLNIDTQFFSDFLYKDEEGAEYYKNYQSDYTARINQIYRPKLDFLLSNINTKEDNCNSISDFGCGGGHFINSIRETDGLNSREGYDISTTLINLAKSSSNIDKGSNANQKPRFTCVSSEAELLEQFKTSSSKILSMLGVLEHLQNPRCFLESFASHEHAQYMFIQVPLFGLSTFIEHSFPNVFPRVLSSGHTHLFTRSSLAYLFDEFKLNPLAEWHFGTDSMDLKRSFNIQLQKSSASEYIKEIFNEQFYSAQFMDEFQSLIDRHFLGSQTHVILSRNHI